MLKVEHLKEGKIARITISRPKAMNAMNPQFFTEIEQVFKEIEANETVRAVILAADGKVFTAGLDLKELGGMFAYDFT